MFRHKSVYFGDNYMLVSTLGSSGTNQARRQELAAGGTKNQK